MMRFLILAFSALAAASAGAFHVQIGFSGKSAIYEKAINNGSLISPSTNSPFRGWTNEVGQTASYLASYPTCGYNSIGCVEGFETESASGPEGVHVIWNNPDRPDRVTLSEAWATSGQTTITIGETVSVPAFGYVYEPYVDYRLFNGVFTCRGDPYSVVMNDTSVARTVNGVEIPAGDSAALLFPIHLKTAEIPNVKFYDLESGAELTPHDYASYGQGGKYYNNGYYTLGYTGNIRISDGTSAPTNAPFETLVFGDMVPANEDKVLYAENEMPLWSAIVNVTTNFQLMTWWDFSHSDWGSSPKAKINDEVVCDGHSTSHIISYTVNGNNIKVNELTGKGYIYFTMSQEPQSGYSGGSCTMRCWDASAGSGTAGYSAATADHKAESSAGTGVARFRVTVNIYAGTWKVEAL